MVRNRCATEASAFGSKFWACSTRNVSTLWSCSAWTAAGKSVLQCLHVVLNEEREHHGFCVRDLDLLK